MSALPNEIDYNSAFLEREADESFLPEKNDMTTSESVHAARAAVGGSNKIDLSGKVSDRSE